MTHGEERESPEDKILAAYYEKAVGSPDASRDRARAAFGIASALAAAAVIAGISQEFASRSTFGRNLGIAAFGLWVAASGLFMQAVAAPMRLPERTSFPDRQQFIDAVIASTIKERNSVERWSKAGRLVAIVAFAATATAAAVAALLPTHDQLIVETTPMGSEVVAALCGEELPQIRGRLEPSPVGTDFVRVVIHESACGGISEVTLTLRSEAIAGARG